MRIFLAALAGAAIVFVVSAILHMATPLGEMGVQALPESASATLAAIAPNGGLFAFSGTAYGLLVITKGPGAEMTPGQLGAEFLANLVAAFIAAVLIARMNAPYGARVLAVALLAAFAFFSLSMSHAIWYKFPLAFVLASFVTEVTAWALAGLAMAKIVR